MSVPIKETTPFQTLKGHTQRCWAASWNPKTPMLASCSGDTTIRIWVPDDPNILTSSWHCLQQMTKGERTIRSLTWSSDGSFLVSCSFDSTITIWRLVEGQFQDVAVITGHENEIKSLSWHSIHPLLAVNNLLIATCARDKTVWIWEYSDQSFEPCSILSSHTQDVKMVKWHPTEKILISASYDDTIKVWREEDIAGWRCYRTLKGHFSTVWAVSFNSMGTLLASCSDDLSIIIWNVSDWSVKYRIENIHNRTIYSIEWSSLNNMIATGSGDNSIKIFRENDNGCIEILHIQEAHSSDVNCVAWCPYSSNIIASCGDDNSVRLWSLNLP